MQITSPRRDKEPEFNGSSPRVTFATILAKLMAGVGTDNEPDFNNDEEGRADVLPFIVVRPGEAIPGAIIDSATDEAKVISMESAFDAMGPEIDDSEEVAESGRGGRDWAAITSIGSCGAAMVEEPP